MIQSDYQQVLQAAEAFYHARDAATREAAHTFLLGFIERSAAWHVAVEMLQATNVPDLQYFAANILYTKVGRDFQQLDDHLTIAGLSEALLSFLQHNLRGNQKATSSSNRLVVMRACLALAALAIKLPRGLPDLMQHAFHFLGNGPSGVISASAASAVTGLYLIRSIPEEVGKVDMSRSRREELEGHLRDFCPSVLQVVEALISERQELAHLTLDAFTAWISVGGFTLTLLSRDALAFFNISLSILASPLSVPRELFISLCDTLASLAGITEYPKPSGRRLAVRRLFDAILAGSSAMEGLKEHEDALHSYCLFVSELAKQEVEDIARGQCDGLAIVEVLLQMTTFGNMNVSLIAMEFWERLADIPMADRSPDLRQPLYVKLTDVMFARLRYPDDFTSWKEEVHIEQSEFERYREGDQTKELLQTCYSVLRSQYLLGLQRQLEADSQHWQASEVVLVMLQEVSRTVMSYLESPAPESDSGGMAKDQQSTLQGILEFLYRYTSCSSLSSHNLVLQALLRFLASYSSLLTSGKLNTRHIRGLTSPDVSQKLIQMCIQSILRGLSDPNVGMAAAMALRSLCVVCLPHGTLSRDAECMNGLLSALSQATAAGQDIEVRLLVLEAITRTAISMEHVDQARSLLNSCMKPTFETLAGALYEASQGRRMPQVLRAIEGALQLVGQLFRFIEGVDVPRKSHFTARGPQNGRLPPPSADFTGEVARDLLDAVWPLLAQTAALASYSNDGTACPQLLDCLFPVYRHIVVGLRALVYPRLHELLTAVVELFRFTVHEGAIETIATVVELFGGQKGVAEGDREANVIYASLLSVVGERTFQHIRHGHPPSECPGLITAFFDMLLRFLAFRPIALYQAQELPTMLDLTLLCLESSERESTRTVLRFLRELMRSLPDCGPQALMLLPHILQRGQGWVRTTLHALAGRAISTLWANYYEFFASLLQAWPSATAAQGQAGSQFMRPDQVMVWVQAAIHDPSILSSVFSAEDRRLLVELIGRLSRVRSPKLKMLLDDVCKMNSTLEEVGEQRSSKRLLDYLVD